MRVGGAITTAAVGAARGRKVTEEVADEAGNSIANERKEWKRESVSHIDLTFGG